MIVRKPPKLEVFISDIHFPHQDMQAWQVALNSIKVLKPDLIYLGGDIIDLNAVSKYPKRPVDTIQLQEELDVAYNELKRLRNIAPKTKIIYRAGNHEDRLIKYLINKAPELAALNDLSIPNLLKLKKLNIEYVANGTTERIGRLYHDHGDLIKATSSNPARGIIEKTKESIIVGHWHTMGVAFSRTYIGELKSAYVNGFLYTLLPEYTHRPNWTHGFSVIRYALSGHFSVEFVPIHKIKNTYFANINGVNVYGKALMDRFENG